MSLSFGGGRTPWSAAYALVGLLRLDKNLRNGNKSRPGAGCGPGGPPPKRHCLFGVWEN